MPSKLQRLPLRRLAAAGDRQAGYNLVLLVIFITVLNILLAAALPVWSTQMKREKESELIARGLQYAEAIRCFRMRNSRYPIRLEELIEVKPRCIRKLWKDPMTEDGKWDLIFATPAGGVPLAGGNGPVQPVPGQPPGQGGGSAIGGQGGSDQAGGRPGGGRGGQNVLPGSGGEDTVTVGPIMGVVSSSDEKSLRLFFDKQRYNQWKFTEALVRGSWHNPAQSGATLPALNWRYIGRPFPPGILQAAGGIPGAPVDGSGPGGQPGAFGQPGQPGGTGPAGTGPNGRPSGLPGIIPQGGTGPGGARPGFNPTPQPPPSAGSGDG